MLQKSFMVDFAGSRLDTLLIPKEIQASNSMQTYTEHTLLGTPC